MQSLDMEDMIAFTEISLQELDLSREDAFLLRCYQEQMKQGVTVDVDAIFDLIISLTPEEIW